MDRSGRWVLLAGIVGFVCPVAQAADKPFVEVYAPGHFGNWYEVAGEREMRAILAEAKHWGYTRYGDWFDTIDCVSPFMGDKQYSLGNSLWDRKKAHFRNAQALGLQTDLIITPNHVFRDQLRPEWLAKSGGRVFGQLICPSVPAAREAILDNYRHIFSDLARAGVKLDAITPAPYDYGGCNCDSCKPWIITFARLSVDIHAIAREYHPNVELQFIGWWWTAEEHRLFAEWMNEHAPGVAAGMALHIPYDQTTVADVPLPEGCKRNAFVHIGYGDKAQPRDIYGGMGPVSAPQRLSQTVQSLRSKSVDSITAYSEGIYDDVNKAILAGLWSNQFASQDALLAAYASRYFGADEPAAREWAAFLTRWGKGYERDPAAERETFSKLSGDPEDWRRCQWSIKIDLFDAHKAIGNGTAWTPARLADAERFWAARERLFRQVYGLGPQRHIFTDSFIGLPWYGGWAKHTAAAASRPSDTSVKSEGKEFAQ